MVQARQSLLILLILILTVALWDSTGGPAPKFFHDDPIQAMPPPIPVTNIAKSHVNAGLDFFSQSLRRNSYAATPAGAVNTIGEVPDSEWFTNRHLRHRMSRAELQQGSSSAEAPVPPFTVTSGKSEGITPGFSMQDAKGRLYFVKGDPPHFPEMATGADVIVSNFLYAIGYNTPKNEILDLKMSDLRLSDTAMIKLRERRRTMNWN